MRPQPYFIQPAEQTASTCPPLAVLQQSRRPVEDFCRHPSPRLLTVQTEALQRPGTSDLPCQSRPSMFASCRKPYRLLQAFEQLDQHGPSVPTLLICCLLPSTPLSASCTFVQHSVPWSYTSTANICGHRRKACWQNHAFSILESAPLELTSLLLLPPFPPLGMSKAPCIYSVCS